MPPGVMDIGLRLLMVLGLVAANGFFVAAEFALVTARKTRIESLAADGHRAAVAVRRALEDPKRFISSCQLGVTMASLALGWVGEATVAGWLEDALEGRVPELAIGLTAHAIAVPLAFAMITFFHISLGELTPKMIALERAEPVALFCVGPVTVMGTIFRPFIACLYWFTDRVLRTLGFRWAAAHHQAYSLDDLKALLRSSVWTGPTGEEPGALAERALDLGALVARQVMVPRTEMVAVPAEVDPPGLIELLRRYQHSRYPVFEGTMDNVVGVVSTKQLAAILPELHDGRADDFDLRAVMNAPLLVPETMPAYRLLGRMKQHRSHLVIVVDEYGATAGIVTLRDLLDRIAGEVRDETELEPPTIERLPDGSVLVDGLALVGDVEAEFNIELEEEYDTLGGLVFGKLGRRPRVGDSVEVAGCRLVVEELDGLRIARVRVQTRLSPLPLPLGGEDRSEGGSREGGGDRA